MFLHQLRTLVMALFQDLDTQTAQFRTISGLVCPHGCGSCCLSDKVEATVLEFLPLAISLMGTETGERLRARLAEPGVSAHCVLYDPAGKEGHCSAYAFRGVVCRLFGFAGNHDRTGQPQLAACRVMRAADPSMLSRAEAMIALEPGLLPIFSEAGIRLSAMDPNLGARRLPINEALREAMDRVELMRLYTSTVNVQAGEMEEKTADVPGDVKLPGTFSGERGSQTGMGGVQ